MAELTDRGFELGSLQALEPVLEEWLQINEDWEDGDAAWWYDERTLVGIFAGAVWRCKGWVLEEPATEKRDPQKGAYQGNIDMVFSIAEEVFWCEAKQCWMDITSDEKEAAQEVRAELENASQEVKNGIESDYSGLAIVFVRPFAFAKAMPSHKQKIDTYIANFIGHLRQIEGVTLAWIFPKDKRDLQWPEDNNYFPGCILVLRRVR